MSSQRIETTERPSEETLLDYAELDSEGEGCGHEECGEYCAYDPDELEREWQDHPERFYWPEDGGYPERW